MLLLVAAGITISRRPDALLNAQFWAEDGAVWYRDAYALGWVNALLQPRDGYFQTISRLTAAAAQLLPLTAAPFLFNGMALLWQILPAAYLVSSRFASLIPSLPARLALAFVYVALPNGGEVHVNITNAQSHLVLLALMLVLCPPAQARWIRVCDVLILALAGLSTIMGLFLIPIAGVAWYRRHTPWTALVLFVVAGTGVIQLLGLASGPDGRSHDPLGASLELFARIVGGQIVLTPLLGARGYAWVLEGSRPEVVLAAAAAGAAILGYAAWRGPLELRLFLFFAACILTVALLRGQAHSAGAGVWAVLALPEAAARYFFFPTLAFILSVLWMTGRGRPWLARGVGIVLLATTILIGVPLDWRLDPFADLQFATHARRFAEADPGARILIPLNPPGSTMELIKH